MMALSMIWRKVFATAIVALLAGAAGVYAGFALFGTSTHPAHNSLDAIVHRELNLSTDQDRQISRIEATYADRKLVLEAEIRLATREIAAAVMDDKTYSDRVRSGIGAFHTAMGKLQEETILHVFEMRGALTPAQQSKFDVIVQAELLRSVGENSRR